MPLFALTIFCGAFLLFLVQPLVGKYILPWFGGGPGVWTTCLLFFQLLLLGGYAYAHWLTERCSPRRQTLVHVVLLAAALFFVPIIPGAHWKPADSSHPIAHILMLLTATIGMPYLVLSATGPLLQRWFSLTHPGVPPYRLYALSNVGSLLALVSYPFLLEPHFSRGVLGAAWSAGLVIFAVLCSLCAWQVRGKARARARSAVATVPETDADAPKVSPSLIDRFLWVALPGVASLLLVATTNKLCLDVAAIPFLWVVPLGVYLLTFILCFDHPRWYSRGLFAALLALTGCLVTYFFSLSGPPLYQIALALIALLFVGCMVCHGELYRLRPPPRELTRYFLSIAAGGAGGSLFVSLGAPLLFTGYYELQLGLVLLVYLVGVIVYFHRSRVLALGLAAGLLAVPLVLSALRADAGPAWYSWFVSFGGELRRFVVEQGAALLASLVVLFIAVRQRGRLVAEWQWRLVTIPALLALLLSVYFVIHARDRGRSVFLAERNFYGAHEVHLYDDAANPDNHSFLLANGGITHGLQFRGAALSRWRTTYYGEKSGVGRAFAVLPPGPRRVGAVGLGTGTVAAYGRPGDSFRFYEINPAIAAVARHPFTYLRDSEAETSVVLGDARLVMEQELKNKEAEPFDLLILDAFSGDAIPVHLLTKEAMELYLRHLRPGGIIAVHISNRHLDLRAAVEGLGHHHRLHFATISDTADKKDWWLYTTVWVLLSADPTVIARPEIAEAAQEPPDATAPMLLWTDDHASLLDVMH